eukprot:261056-Pelagomonas_calceolata.AAC.4
MPIPFLPHALAAGSADCHTSALRQFCGFNTYPYCPYPYRPHIITAQRSWCRLCRSPHFCTEALWRSQPEALPAPTGTGAGGSAQPEALNPQPHSAAAAAATAARPAALQPTVCTAQQAATPWWARRSVGRGVLQSLRTCVRACGMCVCSPLACLLACPVDKSCLLAKAHACDPLRIAAVPSP